MLNSYENIKFQLIKRYFIVRTDRFMISAPWNRPCSIECEDVDNLIAGHLTGHAAPAVTVRYFQKKTQVWSKLSGAFRVGVYSTDTKSQCRWCCLDFDGSTHKRPLAYPQGAALEALKAAEGKGLKPYLERSRSGTGWHVWLFFDGAVDAGVARAIGVAVAPTAAPLVEGGNADPVAGIGIEIFPKQNALAPGTFGNAVWLPWHWSAPEGANVFYRVIE